MSSNVYLTLHMFCRALSLDVSWVLLLPRLLELRLVFELVGWQEAKRVRWLARRLPWRRPTKLATLSAGRGSQL